MITRLSFALLLITLSAEASFIETAIVGVTNTAGTTNGQTITVASTVGSDVRTFTNNVVVPATQVLTNNTQSGSALNLRNQLLLHPIYPSTIPLNPIQTFQSATTNVLLRGTNDFAFTVTLSAGWGLVTYSTNYVTNAIVYRAPGAVEPLNQQTNLASDIAKQLSTSTNAIDLNTPGTNDFPHTIFDDPASASYFQKRASDGMTVGTFDGSGLTNLVLVTATNSINTGVFTVGPYWETNITGDITLGAFAGVPANVAWEMWIRGTNSDTSTHHITFPAGVVGAYGIGGTPYAGYVTNAKAKMFHVKGFGNKATNVFEWPLN